jgi:prolyl oligopeptidase PreP (S9A serine peptidase family)
VLAYANIRGGGEYGRAWHEAGDQDPRQNAFDDYIAAARWLVSAGYTTPSKLVSRGNSNGGLMVAATAMQAPEVFGAVFCRVPLPRYVALSRIQATSTRRPSNTARPRTPSRARISPATRRITTSEPIAAIP